MKKNNGIKRRNFIKQLVLGVIAILLSSFTLRRILERKRHPINKSKKSIIQPIKQSNNMIVSRIYESKNGMPEQNVTKVVEMMEGIENIVGKDDIIIIKPNAQRASGHGNTNTNTIKGFIDLVLNINGFSGEIIITENHHDDPDNSRGWTTQGRNGDFNLNELVDYYHVQGYKNVTKYHWRDGGPNPNYLQFRAGNGGIVSGPEEGDGYVWSDRGYTFEGRKTKMTYPVFTSSYSGVTIDFKNGAWKNGRYTKQPIKFINIAILAHHSKTFGVTAAIKNYLGVIDMSCGEHGSTPPGYYNFHYISIGWSKDSTVSDFLESITRTKLIRRSKFLTKAIRRIGPTHSEAFGGAVGYFMKTIRKADLNILAAEYVGHEGRYSKPVQTKSVIASTDPVALDYYGGKYILFPLGGSNAKFNNPDNLIGPFRKYLEGCHAQGIGTLDESQMVIHKFDFAKSAS